MGERIEMSSEELRRLEVMRQLADGVVTQRAAALALGVTTRQVRRLQRRYAEEGGAGLVSQQRGRPSNRRLPAEFKATILARVRERYADFGPTLAAEYLQADGFTVSKETLRAWMIDGGLWHASRKRRQKPHPPRARRPRLGELVQIDGSLHDWFEGRGPSCSLIAFIDDATSRVMHAHFAPTESTHAYLDALQVYVSSYGRPLAFYSDRHGIFTKHDPEVEGPTQFQRALASLGITGIQALTPQAKGRIERLFQTLQDRLVKALRLARISDLQAANAFLPAYLAGHNARFAIAPEAADDAHSAYEGEPITLARICALHHTRTLSKNLVLTFRRQRYALSTQGQPCYALQETKVTVIEHRNGTIELVHQGRSLPYTMPDDAILDETLSQTTAVDDKTLNHRVDILAGERRWSEKSKPAANHPWRRYQEPEPKAKERWWAR